jgi:beta-phosphoglucomutase-like phosphatase (HAD superfamily)
VLRKFPLTPLFEAIVTSDDIRHGKPHPEIFLTAAARAGVAPGRCLVAEDSEAGGAAAKSAGCACLGLATTQTEADLRRQGADYVAGDFLNLPNGVAAPPNSYLSLFTRASNQGAMFGAAEVSDNDRH